MAVGKTVGLIVHPVVGQATDLFSLTLPIVPNPTEDQISEDGSI